MSTYTTIHMPFEPIDLTIKGEAIKLVQQNKSLTQIHNELQKRGRNVSRSWVANVARNYKKSLPNRAPISPPPPGINKNKEEAINRPPLCIDIVDKNPETTTVATTESKRETNQHRIATTSPAYSSGRPGHSTGKETDQAGQEPANLDIVALCL